MHSITAAQIFFVYCLACTTVVSASDNKQRGLVEKHEIAENSLPPGYRFRPTDEEIIIHYLRKKIENPEFKCRAVVDRDLYNCEPYELFDSESMSEEECYSFTKRVRRYPTGTRSNRATKEGYWKTTGRDKEISSKGLLVGMKKTLVFYQGRAPTGTKTNWIMHEYRLHDGDFQDWVVCRVFKKGYPKSESEETATTPAVESSSSSKVLQTADEMISSSTVLSFSNNSFQPNFENDAEGRSSNDYSYIDDTRWLQPQQVMPAEANAAIFSTSRGDNLFQSDNGRFCDYNKMPLLNLPALQKPFLPGYPASNLSNAIPQYMQNQQLPTGVGVAPPLPPDFGSAGNFYPHPMPDFDYSRNFDPHPLPDFSSSRNYDPHPLPDFDTSRNFDPNHVPNFDFSTNLEPHHMPHFNSNGSFNPYCMQPGESKSGSYDYFSTNGRQS